MDFQNNKDIFNFIYPNDNDQISSFNSKDISKLLFLVNEYYLEMRNKLSIKENSTLGLELEFEHTNKQSVAKDLTDVDLIKRWKVVCDMSLDRGAEINSPIITNSEIDWQELIIVCNIVKKYSIIGKNSSSHVHVGTQAIGTDRISWLNFIKLWSVYENVILRFAYGEYLTPRPSLDEYAQPLSELLWKDYMALKKSKATLDCILTRIIHKRYQSVNFKNVGGEKYHIRNTVEFRCPNGTLNPIVWQNNANLFVHLLNYSQSNKFNDKILEKRHSINLNKYYSLEWSNQLYLMQAIELADMIFDNNLDKVYFLRQYTKSFEIGTYELQKARVFTK